MAQNESFPASMLPVRTVVVLILFTAIAFSLLARRQKLPPGTKRLPRLPGVPWVGRVWDIPLSVTETAWHFAQFFKVYGPIYEWQAMGDLRKMMKSDSPMVGAPGSNFLA